MKYILKKNVDKRIINKSIYDIREVKLEEEELKVFLKTYLPKFMANSLDPDFDPSKPEKYIENLFLGKLGYVNTLYTICAYDNEKPVGILIRIVDKNMMFHIYTIGTLEAYRNKCVASELLIECINDMFENGNIEVILDVHSDNIPAYNLYEKFGFC